MIIYGTALLALCTILGTLAGRLIGYWLGIDANVGGVGIAMILLLIATSLSADRFRLNIESHKGITFWAAMYIPIVVAMAAKQNVAAALSAGWVAISAGLLAVGLGFLLVPVLTKLVAED